MKSLRRLRDGGVWWAGGLVLIATVPAVAQVPALPPLPDRDRTSPTLAPLTVPPRPDLNPLPDVAPAAPPKPNLDAPAVVEPPTQSLPPSQATIRVERVEVLGSTVFSSADFARIVAPYEKRNLTFEELLEVRTAITRLYTDRGYVTSGAFLPSQDDLATGVIKIQVIEGQLERIEIKGLRRLRDPYLRRRLEIASKPPLNLQKLENTLQLLQQNPLLNAVQAQLKAGTRPGASVLAITVGEAPAFHAAALIENKDSPTVGGIRGTLQLSHDNLLGFGDRLSTELGLTSGITDFNLGYTIPLTPRDGTLSVRYSRTTSKIVEEPFSVLDINSQSQTFSIGFRQPLLRTPSNEVALGLAFDIRDSRTFLFQDQPFSFSPGPDRGVSKVRVLRFSQDWLHRTSSRVLAARSQFSLGLPILGATLNDAGIDGSFFSWVGQFQYVQALSKDIVAIARIATQLTPDSMLPLEQFSIGGVDSVRGYRQNFRVGDSGIIGSIEVRFPILNQEGGIGKVELAPFLDLGRVWNTSREFPISTPRTLLSTGLGLRWQVGKTLSANLDWGIPLVAIDRQGETLQDYGVTFSIRLQML
jgi:hemolysin activation/secretion protein